MNHSEILASLPVNPTEKLAPLSVNFCFDEYQQILMLDQLLLSSMGMGLADLVKTHSAEKVTKALSFLKVSEVIDCEPRELAVSVKQYHNALQRQIRYNEKHRIAISQKRVERDRVRREKKQEKIQE